MGTQNYITHTNMLFREWPQLWPWVYLLCSSNFVAPRNSRPFSHNLQSPNFQILGSHRNLLSCDQWSRLNHNFVFHDFSSTKFSTCWTFEVSKYFLVFLLATSPDLIVWYCSSPSENEPHSLTFSEDSKDFSPWRFMPLFLLIFSSLICFPWTIFFNT